VTFLYIDFREQVDLSGGEADSKGRIGRELVDFGLVHNQLTNQQVKEVINEVRVCDILDPDLGTLWEKFDWDSVFEARLKG
jgi:hypothetical protein